MRGGLCCIAESRDGFSFRTVWSARKEDFSALSVERCSLIRSIDGEWLFYVSYVDAATNRWCIDLLSADSIASLDPCKRVRVLSPEDLGVQGVKDPWVVVVAGLYYMLVSYAVTLERGDTEAQTRWHASGDIYNTGMTLSSTAMAVSPDGRQFEWQGDVFSPRPGGWDAYASRIGCLLPTEHGWIGYYDGSASVDGNYEERTGLAYSLDLRSFTRITTDGPALVSPLGSGSLRYLDAVAFPDQVRFYYEYARADGSHELRLSRVDRQ
jgi:hypothetical protein